MKIDLMETQTKKFPLYDENGCDQIGFLVPDWQGYLSAHYTEPDKDDVDYPVDFEQFDDEDGEEKFRVVL